MTAINVRRLALIEVLKANRAKHRKIFLEAQDGYRAAAIAEIEQHLAEARDGKKIKRSLTLTAPMDQTSDYNRAIEMLEMSVDETVPLGEADFRSYVQDQWSWKHQWSSSNSAYSKTLSDEVATAAMDFSDGE